MSESSVAKFAAGLLHAVTKGHMMHLQSRSFAQHMALGDFYEGIEDLADSFIEAYQGNYGIIESYPNGFTVPGDDALIELIDFSEFVKAGRKQVPQDSELQNIIDEIQALADSTLYKLRFLA